MVKGSEKESNSQSSVNNLHESTPISVNFQNKTVSDNQFELLLLQQHQNQKQRQQIGDDCIGDWVVEATTKKKLNVLSVHLTSSKSLVGITGVVSEIQKEKKGRNVYILGSANVGKSAFISALLNMLSYKDPAAASARRYKPIQSAVPGTTLGPIQIDAFLNGGKLYDTPGVHLHHRQAAVVHARDLPALAPQSRLRGQSFPNYEATPEPLMASGAQTQGLMGFSIFWGGLVRIDVIKSLPETRLTFYGPKALRNAF